MSEKSVAYLLEKAATGERLFFDEALHIYREADLAALGQAAAAARGARVPGCVVSYTVDCAIVYTNVCTTGCHFCSLHRPPGHADAYVCSREDLAERLDMLTAQGSTSLLFQGGHNPDLTLDWYCDLLRWLRATYPALDRNCFGPTEIGHMAQQSGLNTREVLAELRSAGLQGLPGGGAELLVDEVRSRFAPRKQKTDSWLGVMREAHRLGLHTTATMVIGFDETMEQRLHHLQRVRSLQDYSLREYGHGFNGFMTWTLHPGALSDKRRRNLTSTNGAAVNSYLRQVAIGRLFLDNILHHQANWVMQGADLSQQALSYGLDDFGGTMYGDNLFAATPALPEGGLSEGHMHALIREAGYTPARRDVSYNLQYIFDDPAESPSPVALPYPSTGPQVPRQPQTDVIPLYSGGLN
jgi:cyclic dehypoxanthinyl futalosine synthase